MLAKCGGGSVFGRSHVSSSRLSVFHLFGCLGRCCLLLSSVFICLFVKQARNRDSNILRWCKAVLADTAPGGRVWYCFTTSQAALFLDSVSSEPASESRPRHFELSCGPFREYALHQPNRHVLGFSSWGWLICCRVVGGFVAASSRGVRRESQVHGMVLASWGSSEFTRQRKRSVCFVSWQPFV
jgi:hypothetical protein